MKQINKKSVYRLEITAANRKHPKNDHIEKQGKGTQQNNAA
jgi:hypothetical protein